MLTSTEPTAAPGETPSLGPRITVPSSLAWVFRDKFVAELISNGAKVRVKTGQSSYTGFPFGADETEETNTTRVIFSSPGFARFPGRRLAEIQYSVVDAPTWTAPVELLQLTVFGPKRKLFHRERLFSGSVLSQQEALQKLESLLKPQLKGA